MEKYPLVWLLYNQQGGIPHQIYNTMILNRHDNVFLMKKDAAEMNIFLVFIAKRV
jgi:hypothetical protein